MNEPSDAALPRDSARPTSPAGPRQRWRLVVARDPLPGDQIGRSTLDAWHDALVASRVPIAGLDVPGGRARLSFGAPLAAAARGDAELVDVWVTERIPLWRLRESLVPCLPPGFHWVRAEDVWLGEPPLPGQVAAADWEVSVRVGRSGADCHVALAAAAARLLATTSIPRTRGKPGAEKPYDLRPLILALEVDPAGLERGCRLRMRTRLDPERGTGRPEEVVAALGDAAGMELEIVDLARSRLILASDGSLAGD